MFFFRIIEQLFLRYVNLIGVPPQYQRLSLKEVSIILTSLEMKVDFKRHLSRRLSSKVPILPNSTIPNGEDCLEKRVIHKPLVPLILEIHHLRLNQ